MADQHLQFSINNISHKVNPAQFTAGYTLTEYIRENALLKGTKAMCKEGGCGVCTVTVQYPDGEVQPINSCLVPLHMCHGWRITTIEGLGDAKTGYHKIQKDLADYNGSQCGFCSPGIVMTMYGALQQQHPKEIQSKLEENFDGNICRCTGYRPIMNAMQKCSMDIEDIALCPHNIKASAVPVRAQWDTSEESKWYNPTSKEELRQILAKHATDRYSLVAGHTGTGVYKHDGPFDVYVDIRNIAEFNIANLTQKGDELVVGAGVTLTQLMEKFQSVSSTHEGFKYLEEASACIEKVANLQIRNMASWAGNLMLKLKHQDFVSDVFILLESIGATLHVYDCINKVMLNIRSGELLQYGLAGLVIEGMTVSAQPGWSLQTYKVMPRYRNAISILSLAVFIKLDDDMKVISKPSVTYAGVSHNFVHAADVEDSLVNKTITQNSVVQDCMSLLDKIQCDDKEHLPSVSYRKSLIKSLFYKAVLSVTSSKCRPDVQSGSKMLVRDNLSTGSQDFETNPSEYPMTQPLPKLDARKQTAGEAQFVGDIPDSAGQLCAVFVKSTIACGDIQSVAVEDALRVSGVIRILTYKDIPGKNLVEGDEPLLCETTVGYYGQPVAIVLAETEEIAMAARELVKVTYANLKQPLLSTEDAIKAKSFYPKQSFWDTISGDAPGAMKSCDVTVSGVIETGEQYPMHTETQVTLALPQEGHYLLLSSTQVMSSMQHSVARLLGIGTNEVEVKVRRCGGGFGAKQSRSIFCSGAAAIGCYYTQKPVRMCMTLEDNMEILGRRQPFRIEYQAGVNKDLKIQALIATVYENCGIYSNESMAVAALRWLDNAYFIPNWEVKIFACKTNQPNHSYIRAPGIASMVHFSEQIVDHMAAELKVSPEVCKQANFYQDGQLTPHGEVVSPCYLDDIWNQLKKSANFDERSSEIAAFNSVNKWRKRAVTMTPLKYGMAFWPGSNFLVHVSVNYKDGSVTIIHGGIELGQGINTKAIQVAAHTLGISVDQVKVQPTSTSYNANSTVTGGSVTSDMNSMGVKNACDILVARMLAHKKEGMSWSELVTACAQSQVDLHAKCFITEKDMVVSQKGFWSYDVFGAACTEAELDVLTGNYIITKMNILYDCGSSFSPDIDIGQIEGGIVMGLGMLLHEEIKYSPTTGKMITNNTWGYHVPMNRDIPENLEVKLLRGRPSKVAHLRSKITGEPPFVLAESAVAAINRCISEFRKQDGSAEFHTADAPFTVEKIHLACNVDPKTFVVE